MVNNFVFVMFFFYYYVVTNKTPHLDIDLCVLSNNGFDKINKAIVIQ